MTSTGDSAAPTVRAGSLPDLPDVAGPVRAARELAREAYGEGSALAHPVEVARLVAQAGGDETAIAAALLHDVLEDTGTDAADVAARAGQEVAEIVVALTEDPTIEDYRERKAALRAATLDAGRTAALVAAADKLARARALLEDPSPPPGAKLAHYATMLAELREHRPDLPLLAELEQALRELGTDSGADLRDPALYVNRELSWLDFNDRVLQIAEDPTLGLADRLSFCSIYSSNLDEFFMVRVAGVHDQVDAGIDAAGSDGMLPEQVLAAIIARVRALDERLHACFEDQLRPALADRGVRIAGAEELTGAQRAELAERFEREVFPTLTPLAVGPARPFPYISNLSLSLAVLVRDPSTDQTRFARVKVPKEILPRFMALGDGTTLVALETVITLHLSSLFAGMEIVAQTPFRVTRDADFAISDEADDLLEAVENELRRRRFGEVVRLELARGADPALRGHLLTGLGIDEGDVHEVDGLMDLSDLSELARLPEVRRSSRRPWSPVTQPELQAAAARPEDLFALLRERDVLVHHPYDSFSGSVEAFVAQAVEDPDVLAIKQTVYRTSDDSPLVPALIRATERGKQAVCLVELKARFDERANIEWARALEQAGVHVTYGIPGLKAHAKALLVVRREGGGIRNYVHIGTGNYHAANARLYTDFGLFTSDPDITADVVQLFNELTGYSRPGGYRRVLVAPAGLRDGILEEIQRTIDAHRPDRPARIAMKMNALVDPVCIRALYRAARAGVRVDLNVRGACCLRPGVPGVSEGIRVVSVVGRFLEHARIFAFERGGEASVYIGSADLMPRNLDTRVELVTPVDDPAARADLLDALERCLADERNAWELGADGAWRHRDAAGATARDVHEELMRKHAARAEQAAAPA